MHNLTEDEWWTILNNNWFYILEVICASMDTCAFTNHHGNRSNIDIYHQVIHAKEWFKVIPLLHYMTEATFGFPKWPPVYYENGIAMIELLLANKDAVVPELEFIPEEGEEWKYL